MASAHRTWVRSTPCPRCTNKGRCSVDPGGRGCYCYHADQGTWGHAGPVGDDGGQTVWLEPPTNPNATEARSERRRKETTSQAPPSWVKPAHPLATSGQVDRVYRRLVELCPLTAHDYELLAADRGIRARDAKERLLIGRLPDKAGHRALLTALEKEFGEEVLLGVPGIVRRPGRKGLSLVAAGTGLLIPVGPAAGRPITSLRLRLDEETDGGRYRLLSGGAAGAKATPEAYTVLPDDPRPGIAVVTEGEFKALACAKQYQAASIGVPGVGSWSLALAELQGLAPTTVLVAWDADHATKPQVFSPLAALVDRLRADGYTVRLLTWPAEHKGIDDALHAGVTPHELTDKEVDTHMTRVSQELGLTPTEETAPGEWEEPHLPEETALPAFPLDVLPPWASEYLKGLSESLSTPTDFAGMFFLGSLAMTFQKRYSVTVKPEWEEPLPLWVLVAASSGSRKSQSFRKVMTPFLKWEERMKEEFVPIRQRASRAIKELTAEVEQMKKKKALPGDIAAKEEELDALFVPVTPRLYTGTATPEAIETKLGEHCGRYALASAESDILSVLMGKYRTGGAPPIEGFLSAWSSENLKSDYQTRADVNIIEANLSMILATQPENAAELYSQRKLGGRGAYGRFLTVLPAPAGKAGWNNTPIPGELERAYIDGVSKLLPTFLETSQAYCDRSIVTKELKLSEGAEKVFRAFYERMEERRAVGGDLQFLEEWAAKACGQCARIAALLHLSDRPGEALQTEVSQSATERAIYVTEAYLIPHAKAVFGKETACQADKVWSVLRRLPAPVRLVDLNRAVKPMSSKEIAATLETLEERNLIRTEKHSTAGRGRPPTVIFLSPHAPESLGTNSIIPLNQENGLTKPFKQDTSAWHKFGTNSALNTLNADSELGGNLCQISAQNKNERNPSNHAVSRISGFSGINTRTFKSDIEESDPSVLEKLTPQVEEDNLTPLDDLEDLPL